MNKVVIVTGASSGFGRSIATALSDRGYIVFGTSRDPKSAKRANFQMLRLDVTSDSSVAACISTVMKVSGRIDVLVNNAGYISYGGIEESSIGEAKAQFETNFFGAVRMANAVLPRMRKQGHGQIINISSMASTIPAPFQGFYASTKAALTMYSLGLRLETKHLGINVSVIEPGFYRTALTSNAKRTARSLSDYSGVKRNAFSTLRKDFSSGGSPEEVAKAVLSAIKSKSPRFRYLVGKEKHYLILKNMIPESTFESGLRNHFGLDAK